MAFLPNEDVYPVYVVAAVILISHLITLLIGFKGAPIQFAVGLKWHPLFKQKDCRIFITNMITKHSRTVDSLGALFLGLKLNENEKISKEEKP